MNAIELKANNKKLSQFIEKFSDSDFRQRFVTNAGQQVMINHVREHLGESIYDYVCDTVAIAICEDAEPEALKMVSNTFKAGAFKYEELGQQLLTALNEVTLNFAIKSVSSAYMDAEWEQLSFDVEFTQIDLKEFAEACEKLIREHVKPNVKTDLNFFTHYQIPPCQVRLCFDELMYAEEIFHCLDLAFEDSEEVVIVVYNVGGKVSKDEPLTKERADKITKQALEQYSVSVVYAGVNDEYEKADNDWGVTVGWLMQEHLSPIQLLECNLRSAINAINVEELYE